MESLQPCPPRAELSRRSMSLINGNYLIKNPEPLNAASTQAHNHKAIHKTRLSPGARFCIMGTSDTTYSRESHH